MYPRASWTFSSCWHILLIIWWSVEPATSNGLNLPADYDPSIRPNNNALTDLIKVSAEILSLQDIDPLHNHVSMELILRKQWTDMRLENLVSKDQTFAQNSQRIWIPTLDYPQSTLTEDGSMSSSTIVLAKDGTVTQTESYTKVHLDLIWHGLVNESCVIYASEYTLSSVEQSSRTDRTEKGEFPRLMLSVAISRSLASWIFCTLLPMFLILVFSYTSLYLDNSLKWPVGIQMLLVRMSMNAFAVLLLILLQIGSSVNNPRTGAITALNVWVTWIAFHLVLFFLIPFLDLLHFTWRPGRDALMDEKYDMPAHNSSSAHLSVHQIPSDPPRKVQLTAKLEEVVKFVSPAATAVFLVVYFVFYCS